MTDKIDPIRASKYLRACLENGIDPNKDTSCQDIIYQGLRSTKFFVQCFMRESFDEIMTYQHDDAWGLIDDDCEPRIVVCCWRGFGKTSSLIGKTIKNIAYRLERYIMYATHSFDFSSQITESIKAELNENELIQYVFGNFRPRSDDSNSYSRKTWFACDPETGKPICVVVPKGAGQQVRGQNVRVGTRLERPSLVIIDDLENAETIDNEDNRIKVREWFSGSLQKCVPRKSPPAKHGRWALNNNPFVHRPPWRMVYMDTLKHDDAHIARLMEDPDWKSVNYAQAEFKNGEYYSLVPELVSHAQVRKEVEAHKRENSMHIYAREKMCRPMPPEDAQFNQENFNYYSEGMINMDREDFLRFIIVDPARTAHAKSAMTAILVVAVNPHTPRIYFRRLVCERMAVEEIYSRPVMLAKEYNTPLICVEVAGLEDHARLAYQNEVWSRNMDGKVTFMWLEARSLPSGGQWGTGREAIKRARASLIVPYYAKDQVYHENSLRDSALERQELSFPRCAAWDAMDCAGYVPQVLTQLGAYFAYSDVVKEDAGPLEDPHDALAVAQALADSEDWRIAHV